MSPRIHKGGVFLSGSRPIANRRTRAKEKREKIFERDNSTCQYCGNPAETLDHIIPLRLLTDVVTRVANSDANIVAACFPCNNHKDRLTLEEFFRTTYWQLMVLLNIVQPGFPNVEIPALGGEMDCPR